MWPMCEGNDGEVVGGLAGPPCQERLGNALDISSRQGSSLMTGNEHGDSFRCVDAAWCDGQEVLVALAGDAGCTAGAGLSTDVEESVSALCGARCLAAAFEASALLMSNDLGGNMLLLAAEVQSL